ncbi:MAG: proton-conducting transporter membrane subunit [Myxococcota bacterium]
MRLEDWAWVSFIPLLPLVLALLLGVVIGALRWELPRRFVATSTVWALFGSLVFTLLAFFELVAQPDKPPIVDRLAGWIGVGVGQEALGGSLTLRFDPLSAVFCLLISGVGFLVALYGVVHMRSEERDDGGYARFFGFLAFQLAAMLILVLADNLLLLLLGFGAIVVGTQFLVGFFYSDESLTRSGGAAGVAGLVGLGGLLFSVVMAFRGLAEMGRPGLTFSKLEVSLPALAVATVDLPIWLGGAGVPLPELLAGGVAVAACAVAPIWPLACWLPGGSRGPVPSLILIQTVTTMAAAGYLLARFSPWLEMAPVVSVGLAWLGAVSAFSAALMACSRFEITRVLAWSSVSQFGFVLLAAGAGGFSESVFHVIAHAFSKGLLLMAVGVVVLAVAGERDMRRMGNLGSRLTLTRVDLWIGVFALAGGLPLTAGFFSLHEVLEATVRAEGLSGRGGLYGLGLATLSLTSFYIVRLMYLSLYGNTRLPPHVQREAIQDPEPRILWPMGIMAGLAILGSVIGLPQIWSDLLFSGGVRDANSLQNFLGGVVAGNSPPLRDSSAQWSLVGQATLMTWLGAVPAAWLYLLRPEWNDRLSAMVARTRVRFRIRQPAFVSTLANRPATIWPRLREERAAPFGRGRPSRVPEWLLQTVQSGFLQHYLGFVAAGSFAVLLYFLLAGSR